jgi:hypothetical protein
MREHQTVQTIFNATCELETPLIQIDVKRKKCGRINLTMTENDLKEAMSYFFTSDSRIRERLLSKYGLSRIKRARAICQLDFGTQGRIFRHICSFHGRQYLRYSWTGQEDGVRIRCHAPGGCTFNTHHDGYLFKGEDNNPANE